MNAKKVLSDTNSYEKIRQKRAFGQLGEIVYKQKKCIKRKQCCFILLIHFFYFTNTVNLLLEKNNKFQ